jgi:hypothetical protein
VKSQAQSQALFNNFGQGSTHLGRQFLCSRQQVVPQIECNFIAAEDTEIRIAGPR